MAFGILAGLFCDFGYSGVLGFHALVLGVLCFIVSLMVQAYMQVNMVTAFLTGIWTLALTISAQWLFFYYFRFSEPNYAFLHHYLPKYLYTLLFVPLIHLLNRGLSQSLGTAEK